VGPFDPEYERDLVKRAQNDAEAFGEIFDAHYERIYSYALKRTGEGDVAADITAETFMKAMRGLPLFRWRGIPLSAWLYRIAGNEINMYFRKGRYAALSLSKLMEEGFDPEAEDASSDTHLMEALLREDRQAKEVYDQLRTLPAKYQEIIALRFFEDKTTPEIARILGKREGTVRSLLSRGLAMLKTRCSATQQNEAERIIGSEGRSALEVYPKEI
jgi:RNA polymerase sigma factor (sigma-70 family)